MDRNLSFSSGTVKPLSDSILSLLVTAVGEFDANRPGGRLLLFLHLLAFVVALGTIGGIHANDCGELGSINSTESARRDAIAIRLNASRLVKVTIKKERRRAGCLWLWLWSWVWEGFGTQGGAGYAPRKVPSWLTLK